MKAIGNVVAVCCMLAAAPFAPAQAIRAVDPAKASVRILLIDPARPNEQNYGSGTIIATMSGRSWVLSCAHIFGDRPRAMKIVIDGPAQPYAPRKPAAARLLACDPKADLSLIEIDNGPFFYVPIAPEEHKAKLCWSCGYDGGNWPLTKREAHVMEESDTTTWTVQKPREGRSGGGLIDKDGAVLVGVCVAYVAPGWFGRYLTDRPGVYASRKAISRFMAGAWPKANLGDHVRVQAPVTVQVPTPLCPT